MSLRLADAVRLEIEPRTGRPGVTVRVVVAGAEIAVGRDEIEGLAAIAAGRPVSGPALALLKARGLVVGSPPALPQVGRVALSPHALVEARLARRRVAAGVIGPGTSLPLSLFVDPELLGELELVAAILREGWRKMISATLARGRSIDREAIAAELAAMARELCAEAPALAAAVDVREPFRLEPRRPLLAESVQFPVQALFVYGDRVPAYLRSPPVSIPVESSLAAWTRLLPALVGGLAAGELRELAAELGVAEALTRLWFASLLVDRDPPTPLELEPGEIAHLGHATLLANLGGRHVLVDPWFVPVSAADTSRRPVALAELPPIDAVLITHHHWDHVHLDTLLLLDKRVPLYIPRQSNQRALAPQTAAVLAYLGFEQVREIDRGETLELGDGGKIAAASFYGEDPTRLGYCGNTYVLVHRGAAALVHVDSGSDYRGRSLVSTGEMAELVDRYGPLDPVFATRRQELGFMIEHPWEFLFREVSEWLEPAENCCNDAAFLAALAREARTGRLVLYSEGGADWYPEGTDFLRRETPTARHRPFVYQADSLEAIEAAVSPAGARVVLSEPGSRYAIGGR